MDLETVTGYHNLWSVDYEHKVIDILKRGKIGQKLPRDEYHLIKKYKIITVGGVDKVTKISGKFMANKDEVISIIHKYHIASCHGGERRTYKDMADYYGNITRSIVKCYVENCDRCKVKRRKQDGAKLVVRPLGITNLNDRGNVDIVDMETMKDDSYSFILHYIEHLTKFHVLRPLKCKSATDVAQEILNIFLDFGAPDVLQSNDGNEFTAQIICELSILWPDLFLVNGRQQNPIRQNYEERSNDLKAKLDSWMRDNNSTQWSCGIRFVQWSLNSSFHDEIKMTPYTAVTGIKPRCGLKEKLAADLLDKISTGVEESIVERVLEESLAREASAAKQAKVVPVPRAPKRPKMASQLIE